MSSLTVRNLDESVKNSLRVRAARHGVSMEEEVRQILQKIVAPEQAGQVSFADHCLAFDMAAAKHYAVLVAARTRMGQPVSTEDAKIAAIALAAGLTVVTRNTKDFENIEGLTLANPWE